LLVEVEKIVNGGFGLARTKNGVCLIPYAVPGDLLQVECSDHINPRFCWIKKIEKPSNHRIESNCPSFTACGGCDFQSMEYRYELEMKKGIVIEDMKRISKIKLDNVEVIHSKPDYYRNNAQFKTDENGNVGFFRKKSNEVVPLPEKSNGCLIIDQKINTFVRKLRKAVKFKKGSFRVRSNREGIIYKKGIPGIEDDSYCFYNALDMKFRIGIDDFFQVNNYLYEDWLKIVIDYIDPVDRDLVVDLFAGSGFISIPVAKKAGRVFGMEINGSAVKNAKYNAKINNVDNIIFKRVDVNRGFYFKDKIDKVVVDPPRLGMSRLLIDEITERAPEIIVYVSCNSSTFSRDVGLLYKKGYSIDKITVVDLFPRTAHVEVIARLLKGDKWLAKAL